MPAAATCPCSSNGCSIFNHCVVRTAPQQPTTCASSEDGSVEAGHRVRSKPHEVPVAAAKAVAPSGGSHVSVDLSILGPMAGCATNPSALSSMMMHGADPRATVGPPPATSTAVANGRMSAKPVLHDSRVDVWLLLLTSLLRAGHACLSACGAWWLVADCHVCDVVMFVMMLLKARRHKLQEAHAVPLPVPPPPPPQVLSPLLPWLVMHHQVRSCC